MVAGINMAIFKDTKNLAAAQKFVKFMTSQAEQVKLNGDVRLDAAGQRRLQATRPSTPDRPCCANILSHDRRAHARGGHGEPVRDRGRHRDHPPVRRRGVREDGQRRMIGKAQLSSAQQQMRAKRWS